MGRQLLIVDRSDINILNTRLQQQEKCVLKHEYTVRANACYHTATTAAATAVTTMNKPIQANSESMGAKSILNSLGEAEFKL